MKDPYEVLGVPRGADKDQIKSAYRALAKKYHPDQYSGSPLEDLAKEKMQEINEAYDTIMSGNQNFSSSGSAYSNTGNSSAEFSAIEDLINLGQLDEAERMLDRMNDSSRPAHWYYLKGLINYKRGWTDQARVYYRMANMKDRNNPLYADAYNSVSENGNGGFRTNSDQNQTHKSSGGCCDCCDCCDCCGDDGCDICSGLICADCCCECFGGDLISCC